MKRININFNEELLAKVDKYAAAKYVSRSAAICVLLANALQADDISKSLAAFSDVNVRQLLTDEGKADS